MRTIKRPTRWIGLGAGVIAWSICICAAVRADDWPQWRGPNRDAVWREKGIIQSIPAEGLAIRWRAAVGHGWSSPVVAAGRVYVTDSQITGKKAQERILCFDQSTGKPLWNHTYDVTYPDWAFTPNQEGRPTATPLISGGRLYSIGMLGDFFCLDAAKGEVVWKRQLQADYGEISAYPSPLIEENLLILAIGGKPGASVVALDKDSGKEVWKALGDSRTNSSPIVIPAGGKRQMIVWTPENVTSLDPLTGKSYWREPFKALGDYVVSTPVVENGRLLVGGMMMKLDADRPAATVVWPASKAAARRILTNTSTGVILGEYVYSAKSNGQFVCLEAATGNEVWETDKVTDIKGGASIHITLNGDSALIYTDRGELIRVRLSPKGYEELGRFRVLQPTYPFGGRNVAWPPPAYANGSIFVRSDKELVCVSLTGR